MMLVAGQHGRHGNQCWTQRSLLQKVLLLRSERPFLPLKACLSPKAPLEAHSLPVCAQELPAADAQHLGPHSLMH